MKKSIVLFITALVCANVSATDQPGRAVKWDQSFCSNVKAGIDGGSLVNSNNTSDHVLVSCMANTSQGDGEGFINGAIRLSASSSSLTFLSDLDKNFTRIEIRGTDASGVQATNDGWHWTDTSLVWIGEAETVLLKGNNTAVRISDVRGITFELNHGDTIYWDASQMSDWDLSYSQTTHYESDGVGVYRVPSYKNSAYRYGNEVRLSGEGEDPISFIRQFDANFKKIELHYTNNDVSLNEVTDWRIDTENSLLIWEGNNSFVDFGGKVYFDKAVFVVDPSGAQDYWHGDTLFVIAIPGSSKYEFCNAKHIVLCEGIKRLKDETFDGSRSLESVHIPASLRKVGTATFWNCTALKSVTFAENSNFELLNRRAFRECSSLPYIELPESLTRIATEAFYGCTSLKVVTLHSEQCVLESTNVFEECDQLQYIYVPAESVDWYKSATNWKSFADKIRALPPSWLLPGDGWDAETNTLYLNSNANTNAYKDSAIIQKVVVDADVTAIGDAAFQNCSNLASVIVKPLSCALGASVFDGCSKMSAIYVPVVAVDAYRNATNWETYRLKIFGKVVWDMSTTSFALDESQESFSQDGVTLTANTEYSNAQTVDNTCNLVYDDQNSGTSNTAFTFSSELGKFTKIALIGVGANNITASGWSMQGDTAMWINNDGSNSVYFGTAVEDVTSIEFTISGITVPGWLQPGDLWNNDTKTLYVNSNPVNNAYENKSEIWHVVVAANVTALGNDAFRLCSNIQTVTFNNGSQLTDIGERAFSHCSSLTAFTVPAGVTIIRETAFGSCTSMQSVTFATGSQLETISSSAFAHCAAIKSIILPETMKDISYNAFFDCSNLDSVVIYAPSLTTYGEAFGSTHANLRIYVPYASLDTYKTGWSNYPSKIYPIAPTWLLPGDEYDYDTKTLTVNSNPPANAYAENIEIRHVVVAAGVTTIASGAFQGCIDIRDVTCATGSQLATISDAAFNNCLALRGMAIPAGVTTIGNNAFNTCRALKTFTFAEESQLQSIGSSAFNFCDSLTAIAIPAGVTSIGEHAFRRCTALESVTCLATTPPTLGSSAFASVTVSSIPLYVPEGSISAYKAAAQWKDFDIQDPTPTGIENANANANASAAKLLRNGQLLIERDGNVYTITGQKIK